MLYGCVTWGPWPISPHCARLTTACSAVVFYADTLATTSCENVTARKRRLHFAGFGARMANERLPKRVMYGELEGGKGYVRE